MSLYPYVTISKSYSKAGTDDIQKTYYKYGWLCFEGCMNSGVLLNLWHSVKGSKICFGAPRIKTLSRWATP